MIIPNLCSRCVYGVYVHRKKNVSLLLFVPHIDTFDVATVVSVSINETFKEAFKNPESLEYKAFVRNFTRIVRKTC